MYDKSFLAEEAVPNPSTAVMAGGALAALLLLGGAAYFVKSRSAEEVEEEEDFEDDFEEDEEFIDEGDGEKKKKKGKKGKKGKRERSPEQKEKRRRLMKNLRKGVEAFLQEDQGISDLEGLKVRKGKGSRVKAKLADGTRYLMEFTDAENPDGATITELVGVKEPGE